MTFESQASKKIRQPIDSYKTIERYFDACTDSELQFYLAEFIKFIARRAAYHFEGLVETLERSLATRIITAQQDLTSYLYYAAYIIAKLKSKNKLPDEKSMQNLQMLLYSTVGIAEGVPKDDINKNVKFYTDFLEWIKKYHIIPSDCKLDTTIVQKTFLRLRDSTGSEVKKFIQKIEHTNGIKLKKTRYLYKFFDYISGGGSVKPLVLNIYNNLETDEIKILMRVLKGHKLNKYFYDIEKEQHLAAYFKLKEKAKTLALKKNVDTNDVLRFKIEKMRADKSYESFFKYLDSLLNQIGFEIDTAKKISERNKKIVEMLETDKFDAYFDKEKYNRYKTTYSALREEAIKGDFAAFKKQVEKMKKNETNESFFTFLESEVKKVDTAEKNETGILIDVLEGQNTFENINQDYFKLKKIILEANQIKILMRVLNGDKLKEHFNDRNTEHKAIYLKLKMEAKNKDYKAFEASIKKLQKNKSNDSFFANLKPLVNQINSSEKIEARNLLDAIEKQNRLGYVNQKVYKKYDKVYLKLKMIITNYDRYLDEEIKLADYKNDLEDKNLLDLKKRHLQPILQIIALHDGLIQRKELDLRSRIKIIQEIYEKIETQKEILSLSRKNSFLDRIESVGNFIKHIFGCSTQITDIDHLVSPSTFSTAETSTTSSDTDISSSFVSESESQMGRDPKNKQVNIADEFKPSGTGKKDDQEKNDRKLIKQSRLYKDNIRYTSWMRLSSKGESIVKEIESLIHKKLGNN